MTFERVISNRTKMKVANDVIKQPEIPFEDRKMSKTFFKLLKLYVILAVLVVMSSATANAQVLARVLFAGTSLNGNLWEYDYIVYNDLEPTTFPDYNLFDVLFKFDPSASTTVLSLPDGWDYIQDFGDIETVAFDVGAPPIGSEIAPGTSLAGFHFLYDQPTGTIPFTAYFVDPNDPDNPLSFSGMTEATSVPEPGALAFAGSLLVGGGLLVRRRRRA